MSRRPGPKRLLAVTLAAAVALAAVLVAVSVTGSDEGSRPVVSSALAGSAEASRLLAGVPQRGAALGRPDAPVTLVEYADLQCPYCRVWAEEAFPALVREYVRTGKVRVVFRGLAFIGPDSERALRAAVAAAERNRLWHVVELLYANQGAENAGWVTGRPPPRALLGKPGRVRDGRVREST